MANGDIPPVIVVGSTPEGEPTEFTVRHLGGFVRYSDEVPPLRCGEAEVEVVVPISIPVSDRRDMLVPADPEDDQQAVDVPPLRDQLRVLTAQDIRLRAQNSVAEDFVHQMEVLSRVMRSPEVEQAIADVGPLVCETGELTAKALQLMVSSLLRQIGGAIGGGPVGALVPLGGSPAHGVHFVDPDPQPAVKPASTSVPMPLRALRAPPTQRIGVFHL